MVFVFSLLDTKQVGTPTFRLSLAELPYHASAPSLFAILFFYNTQPLPKHGKIA